MYMNFGVFSVLCNLDKHFVMNIKQFIVTDRADTALYIIILFKD